MKINYTVCANPFHGGHVISEHRALKAAFRSLRSACREHGGGYTMKITKEAKMHICTIPESEIRTYADTEAQTLFDRDEDRHRHATDEEARIISNLIYTGIVSGRFNRDDWGDMTPSTVRHALNAVELACNVFLPSVNGYVTVFCPIAAWFRNKGVSI